VEVVVIARLHARAGKRSEVQRAMHAVQGPTRAEPGCLAYGAFRSLRDPDEFYIHSRWQDMAAFERHADLPHTVRFLESIEPLLDHSFRASLLEQLW
jgi:quinol monooxygenase YgiN